MGISYLGIYNFINGLYFLLFFLLGFFILCFFNNFINLWLNKCNFFLFLFRIIILNFAILNLSLNLLEGRFIEHHGDFMSFSLFRYFWLILIHEILIHNRNLKDLPSILDLMISGDKQIFIQFLIFHSLLLIKN